MRKDHIITLTVKPRSGCNGSLICQNSNTQTMMAAWFILRVPLSVPSQPILLPVHSADLLIVLWKRWIITHRAYSGLIGQWTDKMCAQGKVKEQGSSHEEPGKRWTRRTFLSTRQWALECKWRQREVTCTESEVSHKSQKDGDNAAPAQDRHCRPFKSHVNTLELGQGSPAGPKRTPDSSLSPWVSMRTFLWIPSLVPLSVTHTRIQKMSTSSPLDSERTWNMEMLPSGYSTADTQGAQGGNKTRGFKQSIYKLSRGTGTYP